MSGLPTVTVIGTIVRDPELRFTQSGHAVCSFAVASNDRKKDPNSGEWVDGDTTFLDCSAWRSLGENFAELTKGARVIVIGRLRQRSYEKDGQKRTAFDLTVEDGGPSLMWAKAAVTKSPGNGGSQPSRSKRSGGEVDWAGASPAGSDSPPF